MDSFPPGTLDFTPEDAANKSTDVALGSSDVLYPSQKAVKAYADGKVPFIIKGTSGDPGGAAAYLCINTADKNVKIYADGAWRQVISWA